MSAEVVHATEVRQRKNVQEGEEDTNSTLYVLLLFFPSEKHAWYKFIRGLHTLSLTPTSPSSSSPHQCPAQEVRKARQNAGCLSKSRGRVQCSNSFWGIRYVTQSCSFTCLWVSVCVWVFVCVCVCVCVSVCVNFITSVTFLPVTVISGVIMFFLFVSEFTSFMSVRAPPPPVLRADAVCQPLSLLEP